MLNIHEQNDVDATHEYVSMISLIFLTTTWEIQLHVHVHVKNTVLRVGLSHQSHGMYICLAKQSLLSRYRLPAKIWLQLVPCTIFPRKISAEHLFGIRTIRHKTNICNLCTFFSNSRFHSYLHYTDLTKHKYGFLIAFQDLLC